MELTFEKGKSKKEWRKQTFCVLGAPKIGKSELFSVGEGTIFLDIEGGLSHLDVVKFPKDRPFLDYDEIESVVDEFVAMKHKGTFPKHIDTIVLDTATRFTQLLSDKTVQIFNRKLNKEWETIEEINLGGDKGSPGWSQRNNLADNILGKLKQLQCAVVIVAHTDNKKVKNDLGVEVTMSTIDIGGQLGKSYLRYSHHILNIVSKVEPDGMISRTVRALGTGTVEAVSRGLCIPDKWVLENPKSRTKEAMAEAAKANYAKLRSFFTD